MVVNAQIKSMKLYHQVERVFNELEALGYEPNDPIDVQKLTAFDQYHYLGTDAVDEAIERLKLCAGMRVLEVGSGIGGPARHIAHSTSCHMTALELQPDLNDTARVLTERCRLSNKVSHVCGDILDGVSEPAGYDALVSWLTFLHIPQRSKLYMRCYQAMSPGAGMYVEDYFARAPLNEDEQGLLAEHVYCNHVPTMDEYRDELAQTGFKHVELIDMTEPWTDFVIARHQSFRENRDRNLTLHGNEIVEGLDHFYTTVVNLFGGGNLGGLRLVAWKPN